MEYINIDEHDMECPKCSETLTLVTPIGEKPLLDVWPCTTCMKFWNPDGTEARVAIKI